MFANSNQGNQINSNYTFKYSLFMSQQETPIAGEGHPFLPLMRGLRLDLKLFPPLESDSFSFETGMNYLHRVFWKWGLP